MTLSIIYAPPEAVSRQTTRWEHLLQQFESAYGVAPAFVARSPGRVNIIGEVTRHCDGAAGKYS